MTFKTYYGDHIFYDDMNKVAQTEDLKFYNKFLNKDMRVLEVACGTGRLSEEIHKHVKDFVGLDYSNDMLEIAKSKNNKINYIFGDMRNLEQNKIGKFDLIICGFNSLQHLEYDKDVQEFLDSCYNILKKDGKVIIDIFNPDMRFLNTKETKEFMYSFYSNYYKEEIHLYERKKYDETTRINYITNIYVNEKLNLDIESNTFMRQYFPGQLEKIIDKSKLQLEEKLGDYNYHKFDELQSPKQIFILKS